MRLSGAGLTDALIAATSIENAVKFDSLQRQASPQLDECHVKKHRVEVKVKKQPESRFLFYLADTEIRLAQYLLPYPPCPYSP